MLQTSDGEYRCRAAVFAIGVTEPWKAPIPGVEHARHYVDTGSPEDYRGGRVFIVGKRNSGFEVATGLLPWASELVLASPRPVDTARLGRLAVRARYLNPLDEYSRGGAGALVVDAAIERIERRGDAFRITARGTTWPGELTFEADHVLVATGFRTPLLDLPDLGLATVSDGRVPGADAVLRKRVRSGRVLRRQRLAGRAGPAQAGAREQLDVGQRVPLQRARPRAAPGRDEVRRRARAAGARAGPGAPVSPRRARPRARALGAEGLPRARGQLQRRDPRRGDRPARALRRRREGRTRSPWRSRWIARGRSIPPRTSGSRGRVEEHSLPPHPARLFESDAHRRELASLLDLIPALRA